MAHDKTSAFAALILAASACLVSAQDSKVSVIGDRAQQLRSQAVYASASTRGNHLDLRFLDWD